DWIGLDDSHFRDALSASLEILGAEKIKPLNATEAAKDPSSARWEIPALHERLGADPSWAVTLDALRVPRKKGQKPWEWRKEAPIRPVVFRDPGSLDGDVVHLHLEHRVVQRLLGRFITQGFTHDELTRACVVGTDHAIPHVIAIGRLSLYGEGASRLHDEVFAVSAPWIEPKDRDGKKLTPLPESEKEQVLQLLEKSLVTPRMTRVTDNLKARLKGSAARDVTELRSHLEERSENLAKKAQNDLKTRGTQEARRMRDILKQQSQRILKRQAEMEKREKQLKLDFNKEEKRQLESDKTYWKERLKGLDEELEKEPKRIRESYVIKARRLEPVGLVYLWPVSS
ncbi:MAG: helicase, partial [Planctomycetota bacterium]|nr:helicase [Planctomycetota bacterium]